MSCVATLGEVAEFINGVAFKPADWTGAGRKIVRIQNLNDVTKPYNRTERVVDKKYEINNGDILVSWSASLGVFIWKDEEQALLNQHIFKVVPDEEKVCRKYLQHALHKALDDMGQHLHGATMKHVNRGEFLATRIYLPPLNEQKRIAAILDKADAIRRKRQQAIDLTEQLLRSVFLDMFGDPVTNPKGWNVQEIGSVCEEIVDCVNKTAKSVDFITPYKMIRTTNIRNLQIDTQNVRYVEKEVYEKWVRRLIPAIGDIFFTREAPAGEAAIVKVEDKVFLGQRSMHFRPDYKLSTSEFLLHELMGVGIKRQIVKMSAGSTVTHLSVPECKKFKIRVPPIELQKKFSEVEQYLIEKRDKHCNSILLSENLFSSLTQQAFNGELSKQIKAA